MSTLERYAAFIPHLSERDRDYARAQLAEVTKAERLADIGRGEFEERSRVTLREYAEEWIERYLGRGRGGFREGTRDEYRRQLKQYIYPYFGDARLSEITPSRVAAFVGHLCEQTRPAPTKRTRTAVPLSDATVRNIMAPLRACLATAVKEGLIRSNPAREPTCRTARPPRTPRRSRSRR